MPDRFEGRRLDRYVVRRRLGTGGFARVYLALDPELEFEVALKVLKAHFADDPAAVERFRREATTAVRLRHPNVVTVLAVGRLEEEFDGAPAGAPYLVMDYLPDSLARRLDATPILPEAELRRVGAEVARGLAYAHNAGVIHRDVKPDNILFGRDGQAVVTDFGIARAVADTLAPATRSAVVGTPSYFSPEQARGLPLDGRTDIYALGVTLYQAATGTLPFTGDDWYAVMRQHVEDPPPPPRERNPALSPELDAIIVRCLAKDPAERFESATELADALAGTTTARAARQLEERDTHQTVVVAPYEASRASARLARGGGRRGGRRWVIVGGLAGAALAAAALAVFIQASSSSNVQPLPVPPGDSAVDSLAALPGTLPNGGLFDTTTGSFGTINDSILTPRRRGTLSVSAPPAAALYVNGTFVGHGVWQSDTLAPGSFTVRAALLGARECASADDQATVMLTAGARQQVRLEPRGCGTLSIVAAPNGASYSVTPQGGGPSREGRLPLQRSVVLPEGTYQLVVVAPMCSEFRTTVSIAAGGSITKRAPLICG